MIDTSSDSPVSQFLLVPGGETTQVGADNLVLENLLFSANDTRQGQEVFRAPARGIEADHGGAALTNDLLNWETPPQLLRTPLVGSIQFPRPDVPGFAEPVPTSWTGIIPPSHPLTPAGQAETGSNVPPTMISFSAAASTAAASNLYYNAPSGQLVIRPDGGENTVRESLTPDGFLEVMLNSDLHSSDPASVSFDANLAGAGRGMINGIRYESSGSDNTLTLGRQIWSSNFTVAAGNADVIVEDLDVAGRLAVAGQRITVEGQIHAGSVSLAGAGWVDIEAKGSVRAQEGHVGGEIDVATDIFVNAGQLHADGQTGGQIAIQSRNLLNAGPITANGDSGSGGAVQVDFSGSYIDTTAAFTSADGTPGGTIRIDGGSTGRLYSSGTQEAIGSTGGNIDLSGREVVLNGNTVDASGETGGGQVAIGGHVGQVFNLPGFARQVENLPHGETQTVLATDDSTIRANALQSGNGGRVTIWADQETSMDGSMSARGGSAGGDGGFIEVSGKSNVSYGGSADAGAPFGKTGTLLLDPKNIIISAAPAGVFPQFDLIDPHPTSVGGFGSVAAFAGNGNIVVTNPNDDFGGTQTGAFYLFNGSTGALISALVGSAANDKVGECVDAPSAPYFCLTVLNSGNFVVRSSFWNQNAGAVTWGNAATGVSGILSDANSLVGSHNNDMVGYERIGVLSNGNYVVRSPRWNLSRGAVTWGDGNSGVRGVISDINSLVGNIGDRVGVCESYNCFIGLNNGNYVVASQYWNHDRGAVTWGDGTKPITGLVSADNSLIGTTQGDNVGGGFRRGAGVIALTNSNYVVASPSWDGDYGAATWGDGNMGITGTISEANSLVGNHRNDMVGGECAVAFSCIVPLTNGNYVVQSFRWNITRGAATWGNGVTGVSGTISEANSLVGANILDGVGYWGSALTNGNYVIQSPYWNNDRGAATWGNGTKGITGTISGANSLIDSKPDDYVGERYMRPLSNGNYVVASPSWNGNRGAATLGNGLTGVTGTVSEANSLVGSNLNDDVGNEGSFPLSNGNYVVSSPHWNGNRGAATWGNGTVGVRGTIDASNSLVGSNPNDYVSPYITALSNGNYVVGNFHWNGGRGAATWGDGTRGVTGTISEANSLVGTHPGDSVSFVVIYELTNGNYVVGSWYWNDARGAATWGDGTKGVRGTVSEANSLIGTNPGEILSYCSGYGPCIAPFSNGSALVASPAWNGGRGALTWLNGNGQTLDGSNIINAQNSVLGRTPQSGLSGPIVRDAVHQTFLARFVTEGTGRVTIGLTDPNQFRYARGQAQTVTLTPAFLTATLNTGTDVVLQASNDITVDDPIRVSAGGKGGALTLQAGRSILVNSNISTDNGALTLIANDTLANGVVDSQRDPGNAAVIMAPGTALDTGTGPLAIELRDGAGRTYTSSRGINLQTITAGSVVVVNNGPSAGSDIRLAFVTTTGSQSYADPNGITTVTGNLTAGDNPITFADSVVVNDHVTVEAGSSAVNFAGLGTQTLQAGTGASLRNVVHNSAGTLQLTSGLTVGGSFSVTAGGIDVPTSSIGMLSVAANIAFTKAATVTILLNGSDSSQILAGGPIDLGGSTLNLVPDNDPAPGTPFTLLATTDSHPIKNTFAGLDEGTIFNQGGFQFLITYMGGKSGNSVVLTRIA